MRILMVGNRYPPGSAGGYERLWVTAVEHLRSSGHTVRVLTTEPDHDAPPGDVATHADVHRELRWYWRDHAFPDCSIGDVVRIERANMGVLTRHLSTFAPELVSWWSMGGMSLSMLGQVRAAGIPAAAVIADDWLSYGPRVDGLTRRLPSMVRRPAGAGLARLLGVGPGPGLAARPRLHVSFSSAFLRDAARASGGWRGPSSIDHPGVDRDRFPAVPARPWAGRLLCCGRLDPRKGLETAIAALAVLPDTTLTIDGDGDRSERARLQEIATRLGVTGRLRWQCSRPEVLPSVYGACDALVFPVQWPEPWGLVPLEAMAVGRPVVASAAGGGVAEYVQPERNAVSFTPGDATGLAAAVNRLARDPGLRDRLVSGGLRAAGTLTESAWRQAVTGHLGAVAR